MEPFWLVADRCEKKITANLGVRWIPVKIGYIFSQYFQVGGKTDWTGQHRPDSVKHLDNLIYFSFAFCVLISGDGNDTQSPPVAPHEKRSTKAQYVCQLRQKRPVQP